MSIYTLKQMISNANTKKVLKLLDKTIKIGRTNLPKTEKTGLVAFYNGRSKCIELTPKIFNCSINSHDLYFDCNEIFDTGVGKNWDDYIYDITKMKENDNKLYSTIYTHNKNIYDYGDKLALLYNNNKKDYSPKLAYEHGFNHISYIASIFHFNQAKSNNFNEFIDNLTKYNNDNKQKKQITSVAQTYWGAD